MKYLYLSLLLLACTNTLAQNSTSVAYTEDHSVFPNPERGFYHHTEVHSNSYNNLNTATLKRYREEESITQILRVFYLEAFRRKPISAEYLDNMRYDFNAARKAGIKVIVRFAYAQSMSKPYNDATPEVVFMHIKQLKPVLQENADVIAVVQAGFIGAWGEWYYTDHFAKLPGALTEENWADRKKVVTELLDALPADRTVQIRTPGYKMTMFEREEALSPEEAFSGTDYSRVGHHNDCFVASSSDFGTYVNPEVEKPYLEQETRFLPMGGETCALASPHSDCENAASELERFHWSYLNRDYNRDVLNVWEDQGCFDEVELRLGYRLRLIDATITDESGPGGLFELKLRMINDGYSSPYNPRKFEVVLKNKASGTEYFLQAAEDPRTWPVKEEFEIEVSAGLPEDMPEGEYQLFLHLPDPYPSLYGKPAYSIRLANKNVWIDSLGYNDLQAVISVSNENNATGYTGEDTFGPRSAKNTIQVPGSGTLYGGSDATSNLLFWGRQTGYQRVVERKTGNGSFEQIAIIPAYLDYFKDANTQPDSAYAYRYYLTGNTGKTAYSETLELLLKQESYPQIEVDGNDSDWKAVAPLSSATVNESFALRAFFDGQYAHFIIYGHVSGYQIYLNTDDSIETGTTNENLAGMDYLIRNDSLLSFEDQTWQYTGEKSLTVASGNITELRISHSLFENLNYNPKIPVYAHLNDDIVLTDRDGNPADLIRMPLPDLPRAFTVNNAEQFNDSRLSLEWDPCHYCEGYVIERSENGSDFQEVYDVEQSVNQKNDNGLTEGQTYFYRLRTYNEHGFSGYTPVAQATVGLGGLLGSDEVQLYPIYPNPATDYLYFDNEARKIEIYNLQGQVILKAEATNKLNISQLPKGIYVVKCYTKKRFRTLKLIKK